MNCQPGQGQGPARRVRACGVCWPGRGAADRGRASCARSTEVHARHAHVRADANVASLGLNRLTKSTLSFWAHVLGAALLPAVVTWADLALSVTHLFGHQGSHIRAHACPLHPTALSTPSVGVCAGGARRGPILTTIPLGGRGDQRHTSPSVSTHDLPNGRWHPAIATTPPSTAATRHRPAARPRGGAPTSPDLQVRVSGGRTGVSLARCAPSAGQGRRRQVYL